MFFAQFVGGIVVGFYFSWDVALVACATAPPCTAGLYFLTMITSDTAAKLTAAYSKAGGVASETIYNMRTVASLQCEEIKSGKARDCTVLALLFLAFDANAHFPLVSTVEYDSHLEDAKIAGEDRAKKIGFANGLLFATGSLQTGLTLLYVAFKTAKRIRDEDDFTVDSSGFISMFVIQQAAQALGAMGPTIKAIAAARAAATEIIQIIDRIPTIDIQKKGEEPSRVSGQIVFENVQFTYPSRLENQIYKNFNLTVEAGTTVALVGSSGSGKSTAVQLVERFYDPDGGRVLLDGKDIKNLSVGWLRKQIGLVGQEPVLFSGTIHDNIARGKQGATRKDVIAAAKMANAHAFIEEFEKHYDTDVGGGGGKLSGGQKQRIAIARAIIKNPTILLLDEATSALDNESERIVQAALDELISSKEQKRTTLVIAHRLTTIRNADKIVVMDKGAVVEQGTHAELMALNGSYVALVEAAEGASEAPMPDISADVGAAGAAAEDSIKSLDYDSELGLSRAAVVKSADEIKKDTESIVKEKKKQEAAENQALIKRVWNLYEKEDYQYLVIGFMGAIGSGFILPFTGVVYVKVIRMIYMTDPDALEGEGATWCMIMIAAAVITEVSEMAKSYGFGTIAARITKKLRSSLYRATVSQNIGYYDVTSSGELCSLLSEEVAMVPAVTGEELGRSLGFIFTIFFALGFAFGLGSPLVGGVFLGVLPFMMLGMVVEFAVLMGDSGGDESMGSKASTIMSEVVSSVRTVASFTLEESMLAQFREAMDLYQKEAKFKAAFSGSARAFSQSSIFIGFGFICEFPPYKLF